MRLTSVHMKVLCIPHLYSALPFFTFFHTSKKQLMSCLSSGCLGVACGCLAKQLRNHAQDFGELRKVEHLHVRSFELPQHATLSSVAVRLEQSFQDSPASTLQTEQASAQTLR